jgi:hypothetical protein
MRYAVDLPVLVDELANAVLAIDHSAVAHKSFRPGVGPYGEPQLVRHIAESLNSLPQYSGCVKCKRTPDLLIPNAWALEFKIARPFGDNGREAEDWSVNLLHPYPGNVSTVGDCLKLRELAIPERKAVIAIGYEHTPPRISLDPLFRAFEAIARDVMNIKLAGRVQLIRRGLIHPVHQQLTIAAWELQPDAG